MNAPLRWDNVPPPIPTARICEIPEGESWVVLLGGHFGKWLHWVGRRTMPCLDDECPAARHHKPAHWTAFSPACLAILDGTAAKKIKSWVPVVLPLNAEQAERILKWGASYPGPLLRITRKSGERGWTLAEIRPTPSGQDYPPVFDVLPTLYRVWGVPMSSHGTPAQSNGDGEPNFDGELRPGGNGVASHD